MNKNSLCVSIFWARLQYFIIWSHDEDTGYDAFCGDTNKFPQHVLLKESQAELFVDPMFATAVSLICNFWALYLGYF